MSDKSSRSKPSHPELFDLKASKALFIRRWGEMGGYWGINRTMAEIHALLFVSTEPLCTDDIMDRLSISRGNASMNLRSLVDWGLIERVHLRGVRKEYFLCQSDVWKMFKTILQQRRRREVEPIVETIERCREMVPISPGNAQGSDAAEVAVYRKRLEEMHAFLGIVGSVVDLMTTVGPEGMDRIGGIMAELAGDSETS